MRSNHDQARYGAAVESSSQSHSFKGGTPLRLADNHQWFTCHQCNGEVGVPVEWEDSFAECPACGNAIQVHGKLLYRASDASSHIAPPHVPPQNTAVSSRAPSVELAREADKTMIVGILCVILGWTVLVPIWAWACYQETSQIAAKERATVPTKATVGLIIALLFGLVQTFTFVTNIMRY